jgi:hypothetical protein
MIDAVTYTLTNEQIDKIAKYRDFAKESSSKVAARAATIESAISYCLETGVDEEIRKFKKAIDDAAKAKRDAEELLAAKAHAAMFEKLVACNGDAKKIAAILAEASKLATKK